MPNEAGFVGEWSRLRWPSKPTSFFGGIQKRQIEYEKTLVPDSEELRKVREDFEKAYLEERESVRLKMCEGIEKWDKAIAYSPEYYAGREQYKNNSDLFMSMERDFVEYTKRRP